MSAGARQSAIHLLAAHLPANPAQRIRVELLIGEHEARCVVEERDDPACPPCQFGHRCQTGSGCPIRELAARDA
jgi:hypothetical protein